MESQLSPRWLGQNMMKTSSNKREIKLEDTSDGKDQEITLRKTSPTKRRRKLEDLGDSGSTKIAAKKTSSNKQRCKLEDPSDDGSAHIAVKKTSSNKRRLKLKNTNEGRVPKIAISMSKQMNNLNFNEQDSEATTIDTECGLNNFKALDGKKEGETKLLNVEFVPNEFRSVYNIIVMRGLELYAQKSTRKSEKKCF